MILRSWLSKPTSWPTLFLLFLSCAAEPPPDVTDPGQLIFLGYVDKETNCSRCHGPEGNGGKLGPDLHGVFTRYSEDKIISIIKEGKGEGREAMPAFEEYLTPEQIGALVHFLKILSGPEKKNGAARYENPRDPVQR